MAAFRPWQVSFSSLPLEMLERVIFSCPSPDIVALSRVSKALNVLSTPLLYRDITLSSRASTVSCCRTLTSKTRAATAVKRFRIKDQAFRCDVRQYLQPEVKLASFFRLVEAALNCLPYLIELGIETRGTRFSDILSKCRIPRLVTFSGRLPMTHEFAIFLNGHPTIQNLAILYMPLFMPESERVKFKIYLPNLLNFDGRYDELSCVLPWSSDPRSIFVNFTTHPFQNTLDGMHCSLERLGIHDVGWNMELIDQVTSRFSALTSLEVGNILWKRNLQIDLKALHSIEGYIARLPCLQWLRIRCDRISREEVGYLDRDTELALATAYGVSCPLLTVCILPLGTVWVRSGDNVWLPTLSESHQSSEPWRGQ